MSFNTAMKFIEKMGYEGIRDQDGLETLYNTVYHNHTPEDADEIYKALTVVQEWIEVDTGYFGMKKITKDEFAREWIEHTKQLWRISYDPEWMERVSEFAEDVRDKAEHEFDRLYKEKQEQA